MKTKLGTMNKAGKEIHVFVEQKNTKFQIQLLCDNALSIAFARVVDGQQYFEVPANQPLCAALCRPGKQIGLTSDLAIQAKDMFEKFAGENFTDNPNQMNY